jgi:hypothetical protein
MTEEEVARAYEAARARADRVDELLRQLPLLPRIGRDRNLDLVRMRAAGLSPPDQWLPLVSVVTAPFDAGPEPVSLTHVGEASFPEPYDRYAGRQRRLRPRSYFDVDAFGLIEELVDDSEGDAGVHPTINRVRIYRQGICEWAHRYSYDVPDPFAIPSTSFAQDVHNALAYFASVYDAVGYAGRFAVVVRIDDAEQATLAVQRQLTDFATAAPARVEAVSLYRETTVDALLANALPLTREAMEHVWQAFGYRRCLLFDPTGNWTVRD